MQDPREEVAKRYYYEELKGFMDHWNGFAISWCSNDGMPMDVIRPGKVSCRLCEAGRVIEQLSARLKEWEGDGDDDDRW